ncbi:hypothetical protein BD777DRAFT_128586 [Yarrowia lipolytica]|nr:hypothetical protein BD777DRAFT_128586 [Yarrowia lipolytica]
MVGQGRELPGLLVLHGVSLGRRVTRREALVAVPGRKVALRRSVTLGRHTVLLLLLLLALGLGLSTHQLRLNLLQRQRLLTALLGSNMLVVLLLLQVSLLGLLAAVLGLVAHDSLLLVGSAPQRRHGLQRRGSLSLLMLLLLVLHLGVLRRPAFVGNLVLVNGVRDFGRFAVEVEIPAHRRLAAKRLVVEGVARLIQLSAKIVVVRVVEFVLLHVALIGLCDTEERHVEERVESLGVGVVY